MAEVSRKEVDGLGERLNKMTVVLAKTEERSEANEKNIETMTKSFDEKSKEFSAKADKISYAVVISTFLLVIGLIVKEAIAK